MDGIIQLENRHIQQKIRIDATHFSFDVPRAESQWLNSFTNYGIDSNIQWTDNNDNVYTSSILVQFHKWSNYHTTIQGYIANKGTQFSFSQQGTPLPFVGSTTGLIFQPIPRNGQNIVHTEKIYSLGNGNEIELNEEQLYQSILQRRTSFIHSLTSLEQSSFTHQPFVQIYRNHGGFCYLLYSNQTQLGNGNTLTISIQEIQETSSQPFHQLHFEFMDGIGIYVNGKKKVGLVWVPSEHPLMGKTYPGDYVLLAIYSTIWDGTHGVSLETTIDQQRIPQRGLIIGKDNIDMEHKRDILYRFNQTEESYVLLGNVFPDVQGNAKYRTQPPSMELENIIQFEDTLEPIGIQWKNGLDNSSSRSIQAMDEELFLHNIVISSHIIISNEPVSLSDNPSVYVNGPVVGDIRTASSSNFKENIVIPEWISQLDNDPERWTSFVQDIKKISIYEYVMKNDPLKQHQLGFLAQEWKPIMDKYNIPLLKKNGNTYFIVEDHLYMVLLYLYKFVQSSDITI